LVYGVLLSGCAHKPSGPDQSPFRAAKPSSLLVLPPLNESKDVKATPGAWAQATLPLAEAGYYVFPAALVDETLRSNGVETAYDAHHIAPHKLREVFGADACVLLTVKDYGTQYRVLSSDTRVSVHGEIVDLRSGRRLWSGEASASSQEGQQQNSSLVGKLVGAVVTQIMESLGDKSFDVAGLAQQRLLAPRPGGVLFGPRSPAYGQEFAPRR
jgi:hypothetical protein